MGKWYRGTVKIVNDDGSRFLVLYDDREIWKIKQREKLSKTAIFLKRHPSFAHHPRGPSECFPHKSRFKSVQFEGRLRMQYGTITPCRVQAAEPTQRVQTG